MTLATRRGSLLPLPLLLLGAACWAAYAPVRQSRLDRALIAAVKRQDATATRTLLDAGAHANARENVHAESPWRHLAVLLHFGRPLASARGRSALLLSAEQHDVACARALLDHGAVVDARDGSGLTALATALAEDGTRALFFGDAKPLRLHAAYIRLLVECGADVNQRVIGAARPLVLYAFAGDLPMVRLLVERGADPRAPEDWPPLGAAVKGGNIVAVRFLLDHGASPEYHGSFLLRRGWVPIVEASRTGRLDILRLLVQRGADLAGLDAADALRAARRNGQADTARYLSSPAASSRHRRAVP